MGRRTAVLVTVGVILALVVAAIVLWRGRRGDPGRQPGNVRFQSFRQAKRAQAEVFRGHRVTFYCGCPYGADRKVDHEACGYVPRRDNQRAGRVEWEHVVPAAVLGGTLSSWRVGHKECVDRRGRHFKGRRCARKVSQEFRYMEADLYNLYPAIGEVNALRSDRPMAEIAGEARELGRCDVELAEGQFEPPTAARGDIARTYFYMDAAYPGRGIVNAGNRPFFEAWAEADPVDEWECQRARRVAAAQGNVNRFVQGPCREKGL
ncbi:MAG: endonuclease [Deltaproteobacteria bacterium]|nr:endonuclease [Deltaproteobacteria bacterium]